MARYVKQGSFGAFKDLPGGSTDPELEYIILSKNEYHGIYREKNKATESANKYRQELDELKKDYEELYSNAKKWRDYALDLKEKIPQEGTVSIPQNEYNGYQKALRIVRERALQQVDKARSDEHGYTVLRADRRPCKKTKKEAWLITRSTPHSIKIPLSDVRALILMDLKEFYGYRELPVLEKSDRYIKKLDIKTMLEYYHDYYIPLKGDLSKIYNDDIKKTFIWLAESNGKVIFEISKIASNIAKGCYEVSYWATSAM